MKESWKPKEQKSLNKEHVKEQVFWKQDACSFFVAKKRGKMIYFYKKLYVS